MWGGGGGGWRGLGGRVTERGQFTVFVFSTVLFLLCLIFFVCSSRDRDTGL